MKNILLLVTAMVYSFILTNCYEKTVEPEEVTHPTFKTTIPDSIIRMSRNRVFSRAIDKDSVLREASVLKKASLFNSYGKVNESCVVRIYVNENTSKPSFGSGCLINPFTIVAHGDPFIGTFQGKTGVDKFEGSASIRVYYWRPDTTIGVEEEIADEGMKVYLHPDYYDPDSDGGNIALIVKSTPFPRVNSDDFKDIYAGPMIGSDKNVKMFGAGVFSNNAALTNDAHYIEEYLSTIHHSTMIAYENDNGGTCTGDNGGPVTIGNGSMTGIISRMDRDEYCVRNGGRMFVTRFRGKIDWINSVLTKNRLVNCRELGGVDNYKCYNSALTAIATANSQYSSSYSPDRAKDGKKHTKWNSLHPIPEADGWDNPHIITFDLGDMVHVKSYTIKHAEYSQETKAYNTILWEVYSRPSTSSDWVSRGWGYNPNQDPITYVRKAGYRGTWFRPFTDRYVSFHIRWPGQGYARIPDIEIN